LTFKNTSFECILACHQMQHLKKCLFSEATKSPFFQNLPTSFENHQRPHSNYIISTTLSKIFILLSSFHVLYWWRIFSPLFCYFFTKSKKNLTLTVRMRWKSRSQLSADQKREWICFGPADSSWRALVLRLNDLTVTRPASWLIIAVTV